MPRIENPKSPLVPKLRGLHLFHFDGAPCAQRVRFALAEKGLKRSRNFAFAQDNEEANVSGEGYWNSRIVSLVKKDHLTEDYAKIQPNLVVPALVHDGVLYTESMDIVEYLDQTFGGTPLIPTDAAVQKKSREVTERGKKLHRSIRFVTFRWGLKGLGKLKAKEEESLRRLAAQGNDGEMLVDFYQRYSSDAIADDVFLEHLRKLVEAYDGFDAVFESGQQYIAGDNLTMADIIWAMKTLRLSECGYPFEKRHPAVYRWYRSIYSRPSFQEGVMSKHRGMSRLFTLKAGVENLLGIGLAKAVSRVV